MEIESAEDLRMYQNTLKLDMELSVLSKDFSIEGRYVLTDQIR